MIKIRVPATSANMGPGFDSLGVALSLYNYISVEEMESGLDIKILDETKRFLPTDERNLIYRSMQKVFERTGYRPKGIKLVLENNIPIARGLGSSSAVIVGGLMAGNAIADYPLTKEQLLLMAAEMEGHADNVTPAVMGGFTVSTFQKGRINYVKHNLNDDLCFAAIIPEFRLPTQKSRSVLPRFVLHKDAVYNIGNSALLAAGLISGEYKNIRSAVGDRLHQSYRKRLVPIMDEIFRICYQNGALGVYLSGAGPTIVAIIKKSNKNFKAKVSKILADKANNWHLSVLEPDNEGVIEIK